MIKEATHYLGSHIGGYSDIDFLKKGALMVKQAGGNLVQIFLTIPGQITADQKPKSQLHDYRDFLKKNEMKVVVHSCYCHNFASDWDKYSWWLKNFEKEIEYAFDIDAIGIVLHFGKKLELSLEQAFNNMYTSLITVHNNTSKFSKIKIFLETSTGQGSEICFRMEELERFYTKFSKNFNHEIKNRFKICIDTCHIFSAGYDIRSPDKINEFLEEFDNKIGLDNVQLVHLNDCKVELGKRVDRHSNIGEGFIGKKGLIYFYNYFKNKKIPIVLETPGFGFLKEIKMLKSQNN